MTIGDAIDVGFDIAGNIKVFRDLTLSKVPI